MGLTHAVVSAMEFFEESGAGELCLCVSAVRFPGCALLWFPYELWSMFILPLLLRMPWGRDGIVEGGNYCVVLAYIGTGFQALDR